MNLVAIFITGLTVGGLTCLAVQGGLLASVISARGADCDAKQHRKNVLTATVAFLLAKLVAYLLLGSLLGALGSSLTIIDHLQTYLQLFAGIYMIIVAFNFLDLHPIFRYAIIQPPRILAKLAKNQSRSQAVFAPSLLGLLTIFIPCGTTLAIEALAISSANALSGALIMATFILGTTPLFLGMGLLNSVLGEAFKSRFTKATAILLIVLGVMAINGALIALGSPWFIPSFTDQSTNNRNTAVQSTINTVENQSITVEITAQGYSPNRITVKKGVPVTLTVTNRGSYTCASAFRIPSLGFSANLQPNQSETFTFTPKNTGTIPFSCSMGMYRGVIEVQ